MKRTLTPTHCGRTVALQGFGTSGYKVLLWRFNDLLFLSGRIKACTLVCDWPVAGSCGTSVRSMTVSFDGTCAKPCLSRIFCKLWLCCELSSRNVAFGSIGSPLSHCSPCRPPTVAFDLARGAISSKCTNCRQRQFYDDDNK